MNRFALAYLLAVIAALAPRAWATPAASTPVVGTAVGVEAANNAAVATNGVGVQAGLVLGTGPIYDSLGTINERIAQQAERKMNVATAVAEEENRLFTQLSWIQNLMNTLAAVQNGIEQIQQLDDTIALAVRYGADFLEFINSLSGPRRGSFFYDSETLAQINRTVNEFQKLKHWKASFDFDFQFPTDRVAQPTGVKWDTINRRLGVAVDKMDSVLDEVSPMEKPLRSSLNLAANNAVLNYSTQTVQKGVAYVARNSIVGNKIAMMNTKILKEMAELEGRKTDAKIMQETAAEIANHSATQATFNKIQNLESRQLASRLYELQNARPSMTSYENQALQESILGDVFSFPDDDNSALEAGFSNSRAGTSYYKGRGN